MRTLFALSMLLGFVPLSHAELNVRFDVPAQSLVDAVRAVAAQSNTNIFLDSEIQRRVAGRMSVALQEEMTLDEALAKLLQGSGIEPRFVDDKTITLVAVTAGEVARAHSSQTAAAHLRVVQNEQVTQDTQSNTSAPQPFNSAAQNADSQKLEEIVVTARKREERVQDVPSSIYVLTASDIDRRGLVSAEDYLRGIPGVNQMEGGSQGQSIIIRGLETQTNTQNITSGPTVATYFGETPTTTTAGVTVNTGIDIKLVDIERVEVLRGPQGTSFGNASLSGAVRTIPVAPKLDGFEGKVAGGYSATSGTGGDNYNIQAVANFPVVRDKFAVRVVGYQYQESGFYRNLAGSDAAFQEAAAAFGAQAYAIDEEDIGAAKYLGGRISALFQATDALKFTVSYLSQKTEVDGFAQANSGIFDQTILQAAEEHRRRGETGMLFDTNIDIANAIAEYDFGWASLLATYSYTESGTDGPFGFTVFGSAIRAMPLSAGYHNEHRAHVGEIRLSTQFEGPWNFLAGLYAEDLEDAGGEDYIWHGDPATFIGARDLGAFLDQRTLKQKAAFGEVSWEFVEGLTLTGGIRAYDYDRTYQNDAGGGALYPPEGTHAAADTQASGQNFRANLSYKRDNTLLYAGWSEGFRLGRPQIAPPAFACDINGDGLIDGTNITLESLSSLNSDGVDNYELGGKFTVLDRRVQIDAAVFRMDWSDIPFAAIPGNLITPECFNGIIFSNAGTVANIGAARSEGIEAQVNYQVTQAFRVDVGGSWIRAELDEDAPSLGYVAGQQLPGAPEVNANLGLQYDFGIAGHAASVRADAIYVGPFNNSLLAPTNPASGADNEAGDYVKLDASARLSIGDLDLDLFLNNLTDEDSFTSRWFPSGGDVFYGTRLRPRTVGLQLSYDF